MRNKKMISFCGILAISAVALTTALSVTGTNLTTEIQAADKEYHEVFTSVATEGEEHYLITSSGTKFPLSGTGTYLAEGQGLVSLNAEDDFMIACPIGDIFKLEVKLEVNGVPYVQTPNDAAPLDLLYANYVDIESMSIFIDDYADEGFRTIYEWGKNRGPSLFSFTGRMDNVTIKSLTLDYTCKHISAESLTDPNKYYLLGNFVPAVFDGYCAAGLESTYNDQAAEYSVLNKYARQDEIIYFKKPYQEAIPINLKQSSGNCAVREGKVRYYDETADTTKLFLSKGCTYNFYFKEVKVDDVAKSIDMYVTMNINDYSWYLVGDEFSVNGQTITNNWLSNEYEASKLTGFDADPRIITGVTLSTGKGFKVRSAGQGLWVNTVSVGQDLINIGNGIEGNDNIFVNEAGTYDITLKLGDKPTLEIKKSV